MLHSFFSSRFYSFTIVGTVAFAVAAVLMMGFLHGKVQRTFLEAMRTRHLQGMSTLSLIGRDTVDKHLSLIRQEMRDIAATHGKRLRDADHEQRGRLLSRSCSSRSPSPSDASREKRAISVSIRSRISSQRCRFGFGAPGLSSSSQRL